MVGKKRGFFPVFVQIVMVLMVIVCLYPFVIMIMSSVSSESSIMQNGYNAIPKEFGLQAYNYLLKRYIMVFRSYGITILATAIGTTLGLFI